MNRSLTLVAAGALATTAGLTACGGSSTAVTSEPATSAAPTMTVAEPTSAATTPPGFPVGSWAKINGKYHETVVFGGALVVKLQDSRGMTTEDLRFPKANEVTFTGGDGAFCFATDVGTYRYAVAHHRLTFELIGKDHCHSRSEYLTGRAWTRI